MLAIRTQRDSGGGYSKKITPCSGGFQLSVDYFKLHIILCPIQRDSKSRKTELGNSSDVLIKGPAFEKNSLMGLGYWLNVV